MNAATILLILATAGQSGWTPDRYEAASAASAPNYDRYPAPPASSASSVSPPPSVIDRARTAVTETGSTLRDGVEAGIESATRQLSRGTNPFSAASASPPSTSRTRGSVAPPPWADSSAITAPDWAFDTNGQGASADRSEATTPRQTESGWTSIGTDVAAPPMLIPQLTVTPAAGNNGPAFPVTLSGSQPIQGLPADPPRSAAAPATGADSWATGWGTAPGTQPAAIGRTGTNAAPAGITRNGDSVALQPVNPALKNSQTPGSSASQPAAAGWPDPWADNDPWPQQSPQTLPPATATQSAGATFAAPVAASAASQPIAGSPANGVSAFATAPSIAMPTGSLQVARSPASQVPPADQPPWMPLLVVSLSLAGSLGANLFLGFSYLEARQKYRSLVRKTADKFRRPSAAAA